MRAVAEVKSGQLRRWRELVGLDDERRVVVLFVVLDPYAISRSSPPTWTEPGWYILIGGRQQWVAEVDIEDDSDLLEDI